MLMNSEQGLRCGFCGSTVRAPLSVSAARSHAVEAHGLTLTACFENLYMLCDARDCRRATPYLGAGKRGWQVDNSKCLSYEWCPEHRMGGVR